MHRKLPMTILLILMTLPVVVLAQSDDNFHRWELVVDELERPVYITHAGDGSGRLFIVEQTGLILVLEDGEVGYFEPFLDISGELPPEVFRGAYSEQGLLGLAFHPEFEANGTFFTNHTDQNGTTIITKYQVGVDNPNVADMDSAEIVLTIEQPFNDHNGGHILFGPDGYLYIGMGDGGGVGDPMSNGQNTSTLLATMLRIDVDESPYAIPPDNPFVGDENARDEIWAYGLRNPWRFSFDAETGDLYIGDVGQGALEEVNFQPADSPGGENYGWNIFEGTGLFLGVNVEGTRMPVLEYDHGIGCSITGGYVYRGSALESLNGQYIYGDYCTGVIWAAQRTSVGTWVNQVFDETDFTITSFGVDEDGELYIVDYKGAVYQLVANN